MAVTNYDTGWHDANGITYDYYGSSGAYWNSLAKARVNDNSGAYCTINKYYKSSYLLPFDYRLNVPANAQITGIQIRINKHKYSGSGSVRDNLVVLRIGGYHKLNAVSRNVAGGTFDGTYRWYTYGSQHDMLGAKLTPAIVNNGGFGIGYRAIGGSGSNAGVAIDDIQIKVFYAIVTDDAEPAKPDDPTRPPEIPNNTKVTGWYYPSTVIQNPTRYIGGTLPTETFWTDPSVIQNNTDVTKHAYSSLDYADVNITPSLKASGYGFTILAGSQIVGADVAITKQERALISYITPNQDMCCNDGTLTGFNAYHSGTLSVVSSRHFYGAHSLGIVTTTADIGGTYVNSSAGINNGGTPPGYAQAILQGSGTVRLELRQYSSGGTLQYTGYSNYITLSNTTWQHIDVVCPPLANLDHMQLLIYTQSATASTIYVGRLKLGTLRAPTTSTIIDKDVQLVLNDTLLGSNASKTTVWGASQIVTHYGSVSDKLGATITSDDVNSSGFGVTFEAYHNGSVTNQAMVWVSVIAMRLYYVPNRVSITPISVDSVTCGYKYRNELPPGVADGGDVNQSTVGLSALPIAHPPTITVSSDWCVNGGYSYKVQCPGSYALEGFYTSALKFRPKTEYTVGIPVKGIAGTRISVDIWETSKPTGANWNRIGINTLTLTGGDDDIIEAHFTPSAQSINTFIEVYHADTSTTIFYVDSIITELGDSLDPYIMGGTSDYKQILSFSQAPTEYIPESVGGIKFDSIPNQYKSQLGYIGLIDVDRGHHYESVSRKNTLVMEQTSGAVNYGKSGEITDDVPLTINLPQNRIKTLEGMVDLQGIVPINTVISLPDNDPYAHRGYAIITGLKHTRVNGGRSLCNIDTQYVTKDLQNPLTVDYSINTTPPIDANILANKLNSIFYLDDVIGNIDDIKSYMTLNGSKDFDTFSNTGNSVLLNQNNMLWYSTNATVTAPYVFSTKFSLSNSTSQSTGRVYTAMYNTDLSKFIGIAVSNSDIYMYNTLGTQTYTQTIDADTFEITLTVDINNYLTITINATKTSTGVISTYTIPGGLINTTDPLRGVVYGYNTTTTPLNYTLYKVNLSKYLFTDNIDTAIRNIIHIPEAIKTNIPYDFIRITGEGKLYSYINPNREILFNIDPSTFFDSSVRLLDESGTQILSPDMTFNNSKVVTLENGVLRIEFDLNNKKVKLYGFNYGWVYVGTLSFDNMFHIKALNITMDSISIQVGETQWTLKRGKPFVTVSHPYDDFIIDDNLSKFWHDNGSNIGIEEIIDNSNKPILLNGLFYCLLWDVNNSIGLQIIRPKSDNINTKLINKSSETGIGWYNLTPNSNEKHSDIALEYLAKSSQDVTVYI
ncbi:MAG: hypothetical protein K8E24_014295 [Methanobacterium paludis]|nr:hypothetical protein [Methanobacterium paludis]